MPSLNSLCALMLCLAVGNLVAAEDQGREIGWVLEYGPPQAVHFIHRTAVNQPIEVKAGTPLRAGDVLSVQLNGRILIALADGSEHEVSGNGSWKVPSTESHSAIWKVMQSVLGLVDRQALLATSAVTRGGECVLSSSAEPLIVPILSRQQSVVGGRQTLTFEFRGGCAPFSVELERGKPKIAAIPSVKSRRFSFRNVVLRSGTYDLLVRDAGGREIRAPFHVVHEAPPVPTSLAATSSTLRQLAEAMWLSEQDEGRWRLESVKRLEPLIAQGQPIAVRMADALLSDPR